MCGGSLNSASGNSTMPGGTMTMNGGASQPMQTDQLQLTPQQAQQWWQQSGLQPNNSMVNYAQPYTQQPQAGLYTPQSAAFNNGMTSMKTDPTQDPTATQGVAPPSNTYATGSGSYTPSDIQQTGVNAAQQQNNANGIAPPPSNFARWQTYQPFTGLHQGYAPLQGQGPQFTGNTSGTGQAPGNGRLGGSPLPPMGTSPAPNGPAPTPGQGSGGAPRPSANGQLTPPGASGYPGSGVPVGGSASGYGASNLSNGNYSMQGFRFSDAQAQANPLLAQFNQLQDSGNPNDAYSTMLANPQAANLFQSAFAGSSNPATEHQIVNSFTAGGGPSYFGANGYNAAALQTQGHVDPRTGQFVQGTPLSSITNPAKARMYQKEQNAAGNAAKKGYGAISG